MQKNIRPLACIPVISRAVLALNTRKKPIAAIIYQPLIQRSDYDAFRRIIGDGLPKTFGTWLHVRRESGMEMVYRGHNVADVKVRPEEFAAHCDATGQKPTLQHLWDFARKVTQQPSKVAVLTYAVPKALTIQRTQLL
jgi:hypothetical protein